MPLIPALAIAAALLGVGVAVPLVAINSPGVKADRAAMEQLAGSGLTGRQLDNSIQAALDAAQAACDGGTPAPVTENPAFDNAVAAAIVELCGR
jgi:hypothetical protein